MDIQRTVATILIIAGSLGLAYGGFSYTKETHRADLGALHMSVDDNEYVNVPAWAGVSALIAGSLLLIVRRKI
jgi:TRAP-type C4-dicarboxylate transport system permease small subunit